MLNLRTVSAGLACLMMVSVSQAQLNSIRTETGTSALMSQTLNYQNVTAKKVVARVSEENNNEKQLDVGDFDNDGDLDAVMAISLDAFGQRRNKLWRNDNGVMTEISGTNAIPGFSTRDNSRTAFLRDYDSDGWLDIIVINDSNSGGTAGRTKYFSNKHVNGVFSHYVEESSRLNGATGAACDGESADFNNDGTPDLYLGNYPFNSQDYLGFNDGTGNFTTVTSSHVPNDTDYTVDIAVMDLNP
ncbi:MAG: VCBS repeat-containing protein, partial [Planctomycetota bacterium]